MASRNGVVPYRPLLPPQCLTDAQVQDFVVNGYLVLPPSVHLETALHDRVFAASSRVFNAEGDPGNNILPHIPELLDVFETPEVAGALSSLLGDAYMFHSHRRAHRTEQGSSAQGWHKDTYKGRQNQPSHRLEWLMAMYYPQDTPPSLGPTEVWPGTQCYRGGTGTMAFDNGASAATQQAEWSTDALPFACVKGTVVLIHYDIWHRAGCNRARPPQQRFMHKFQFARMGHDQAPRSSSLRVSWKAYQPPWLKVPACPTYCTNMPPEVQRALDLPGIATDFEARLARRSGGQRVARLQGDAIQQVKIDVFISDSAFPSCFSFMKCDIIPCTYIYIYIFMYIHIYIFIYIYIASFRPSFRLPFRHSVFPSDRPSVRPPVRPPVLPTFRPFCVRSCFKRRALYRATDVRWLRRSRSFWRLVPPHMRRAQKLRG
jgi:hypothetical protein